MIYDANLLTGNATQLYISLRVNALSLTQPAWDVPTLPSHTRHALLKYLDFWTRSCYTPMGYRKISTH
jgi:hypothetical protein